MFTVRLFVCYSSPQNISLVLECCTSILASTKLPLIIQLVWRCTNVLLNDHKSTGFQLKSLDSVSFVSPLSC